MVTIITTASAPKRKAVCGLTLSVDIGEFRRLHAAAKPARSRSFFPAGQVPASQPPAHIHQKAIQAVRMTPQRQIQRLQAFHQSAPAWSMASTISFP